MTSLDDFGLSAEMIEVMKTLVRKEIERQRPAPKVALVTAINEADKTLSVVYTGEQTAVKVPYANVVPAFVGQYVRINGTSNDRYVEAVLGTDITKLTANDAYQGATDAGDQATSVGSQLDTNLDAIRSNRPIGDGPDPTGEASIRWDAIAPTPYYNIYCDDAAHTHNGIRAAGLDIPVFSVNANAFAWAFIRCGLTRPKETLAFAANKSGTVTTFVYDIYEINTQNGSSKRIYTSQNLANMIGTGDFTFVQFNYDVLASQPGKSFGIQFRVTGSGQVSIVGKQNVYPIPLPGLYPPAPGGSRLNASSNPAPDTFTAAQMAPIYGGFVPYVQMGSVIGNLDLRRHFFDYANRSGVGNNWLLYHNGGTPDNFYIEGNQFAYYGYADGYQYGVWALPMASDNHRVYATFEGGTFQDGGLTLSGDLSMGSNLVALLRNQDRAYICTYGSTGINAGPTTRVVKNKGDIPNYNELGIRYESGTNRYIVDSAGVDVPGFFWEDTAFEVPHGPNYRAVGMRHQRYNFGNSSRMDNWGADDV